jgi:hypothetical protein
MKKYSGVKKQAQKRGLLAMFFVLLLSMINHSLIHVHAQDEPTFYLSRAYDPFSQTATISFNVTSKISFQALDVTLFLDENIEYLSISNSDSMSKFVYAYNDKLPYEFQVAYASATQVDVEGTLFSINFKMPNEAKVSIGHVLVNDESQQIVSLRNFTLEQSEVILKVNDTHRISSVFNPENATLKTLMYSSTNEKIATVSGSGEVTALSLGESLIRVTSLDGSIIQSLKVYVVSSQTETKPTIPVVVTPPQLPSITRVVYSLDDLSLLIEAIQNIEADTITLLISANNHTLPSKLFDLLQKHQKNLIVKGINFEQYTLFTLSWPTEKMRVSEDINLWIDAVKVEIEGDSTYEFSWITNIKQSDLKPVIHLNAWFTSPQLFAHKYFASSGYSMIEEIDNFDYEKGFSIFPIIISDKNLSKNEEIISEPSQQSYQVPLILGGISIISLLAIGLIWRKKR